MGSAREALRGDPGLTMSLLSGSDHRREEGEAMAGPPRGLGRVASGKKLPVCML